MALLSDGVRQERSWVRVQVVPSRYALCGCWNPSMPRGSHGWRGGSQFLPLCAQRAPSRGAGHGATVPQPSGFWPGAGLASGQLETQPEEFRSICTHGPLPLRVQLEVIAQTILFPGTMPWARPVWSRRFDVLKKKKNRKTTHNLLYFKARTFLHL